jgi:Bacterial pre-peptidase C-terminal domain
MTKTYLHYAVAAAFCVASGIGNVAFADEITVNELEAAGTASRNDTIQTAQPLTVPATGDVIRVIGSIGLDEKNGLLAIPDVDFYSFQGRANDTVRIDIDGGSKTALDPLRSLDSLIAIFDPSGAILAQKNNVAIVEIDDGSLTRFDPWIEGIWLPATGRYTVAVTSDARYSDTTLRVFVDGGTTQGLTGPGGYLDTMVPSVANGRYTLVIEGVSATPAAPPPVVTPPPPVVTPPPPPVVTPAPPEVINVSIDVRPNAKSITTHANSHGKIPVAIKSSRQFDALKADRDSIKFGPLNGNGTTGKCNKHGADLLCHFDKHDAGFDEEDSMAVITGKINGKDFKGQGWAKVIPARTKD